jgi:hypothetical protein
MERACDRAVGCGMSLMFLNVTSIDYMQPGEEGFHHFAYWGKDQNKIIPQRAFL